MYSQIVGEECSDCEMMNSYSTEKIEPPVAIKVMADVNSVHILYKKDRTKLNQDVTH